MLPEPPNPQGRLTAMDPAAIHSRELDPAVSWFAHVAAPDICPRDRWPAGLAIAAARGSPKGIVRTPMPQQGMQSKHRARKDVQQGMSFLKAGDLEAARAIFSRLAEEQPELAMARFGLGQICLREG